MEWGYDDALNFYSLLGVRSSVRTLAGFLLTGFLCASPGVWLPVWGYHIQTGYMAAGAYFLFLAAGIAIAVEGIAQIRFLPSIHRLRWIVCLVASAAMFLLAILPAAVAVWGRMFGFLIVGLSAGLLNVTLFDAIPAMYERNPGATASAAGVLFGSGCLFSALLAYWTLNGDSSTAFWIISALLPGIFAIVYACGVFPEPDPLGCASISQALAEFRSPAGVLLAFLIFFEFGSEWSIAGWLPVFLIHRVGISPGMSLLLLTVYWLALLVARIFAFRLFWNRVNWRSLLIAAWAALFGCIILLKTDNKFGAWTGILLAASGFAALTPLISRRIRDCFPNYHPGFFNGVFAFALAAGMLWPALLGMLVDSSGIWIVMAFPLLGAAAVCLLFLLMWLDRRFRRGAYA